MPRAGSSSPPPEALLSGLPAPIQEAADRLRDIVLTAVPEAIERVRSGWALIGYDVPVGRKRIYFAFVAPEPIHVHLGFEYGVLMDDPDQLLEGAHLRLKKVRFLTFRPGDPINDRPLIGLTREAARVAALPRERRLALALDREWAPPGQATS